MSELTQEELLERDRHYLGRAANVADWERELIEEGLAQGKRLLPDYLSSEQPIFCPVWRLRLWVLQRLQQRSYHRIEVTPEDTVRQMIWGLDYEAKRDQITNAPGVKVYCINLTPGTFNFTAAMIEIPVEW